MGARSHSMVTAAAALLSVVTLAGQEREIGRISFFGQDGFDVAAIKAVLPYREGSRIPYGALGVRNNAVRALAVLLTGKPELSRRVPGRRFIDLLSSGTWSDRNKGLAVIAMLVARREAGLLRDLRARASTPLLEMAQWPWMHARPARVILGRIIGIPEQQLGAVADEEPPITLLRRFRER